MESFRDANFDFLGKKKPFIAVSVLLIVVSGVSLAVKGGPKYGIDFRGGTMTTIKFANRPSEDQIRQQALYATLLALGGMLVYIALRLSPGDWRNGSACERAGAAQPGEGSNFRNEF
jgi:preprotein translocase subunit SecF